MYTVSEAAKLLKLSVAHVRRLADAGQIPAKKHGRDWVILKAVVYPTGKKLGRPRKEVA